VFRIEHFLRLPRRVSRAMVRYLPVLNLHRRLEVRLLDGWLGDSSGYEVLDVGCGRIPYALKLAWASVTAMDMSVEAIAVAERLTEHLGLDKTFTYVVGCATEVPLRDGSFDVVVCNCVLEHIMEDELALQEMHRVLKPNGLLFLTVDCEERDLALGWVERLPRWTKRLLLEAPVASAYRESFLPYVDDLYDVVRRYSAQGLQSDLEKLGFEVVNSSYYLVGFGAAIHEAAHAFRVMNIERGLSRMVYWFISVLTYPLVVLGEGGGGKGHGLAFLATKKARE
jgi:ubiquinone/menaquinone biosynthesis C-methylase UbiE